MRTALRFEIRGVVVRELKAERGDRPGGVIDWERRPIDWTVIAKSEATKQPRGYVMRPLGCFAALAMTM
jgi:hypothetical protein